LRFLAAVLFLAVVLSVATAGCRAQKIEPITIEVWDGPRPDPSGDKFAWVESRIAEFRRKYPDVTVNLTKVSWQEMVSRLDQQLVAGRWPDIVPLFVGAGGIKYERVNEGLVEPTDGVLSQADLSDIYPAAKEAFSAGGRLYGFPMGMRMHVMLLNLEIFRERGVEPPQGGRWTFDEFVDKAKKLTFLRGKQKTPVYGFATYVQKGYYEVWPFLYMDGARPLSPDLATFTFDSREAISALQRIVDLKYKAKVTAPETGSSDHGGVWHAFASPLERRVAVEPWADWAILLAATDPRFKTDIMVAEYPVGASKKPVTIGSVSGFSVLKQSSPAKRKLTMQLAAALSGPDQQEYFASRYGLLPARRSVARDAGFPHPEIKRAAAFLDEVEILPQHPQWVQIENSINAQIQAALLGEKTPEQALKDARREVEALISLPQ